MKIQTYVRFCAAGATAVSLLFTAGCANRKVEESRSVTDRDSIVMDFPLPAIPDSMKDPDSRMRHLLYHYWTAIDWSSRQASTDTAFMEQAMVNFLELMQHTDSTTAAEGYRAFLRSTDKGRHPMAGHLIKMTSEYLFNPESPVYNPQTYAIAIDALMAERIPGEAESVRYMSQHQKIMKNRPGIRATDFGFITLSGTAMTLGKTAKEFAAKAPADATVILFFYDPDCDACEEVEKRLAQNEQLNRDIEDGKVLFVAVDPYGTEPTQWKAHAEQLPANWTVGHSPDGKIDEEELYMLKASPTVYILKPDLTVIGQDVKL